MSNAAAYSASVGDASSAFGDKRVRHRAKVAAAGAAWVVRVVGVSSACSAAADAESAAASAAASQSVAASCDLRHLRGLVVVLSGVDGPVGGTCAVVVSLVGAVRETQGACWYLVDAGSAVMHAAADDGHHHCGWCRPREQSAGSGCPGSSASGARYPGSSAAV